MRRNTEKNILRVLFVLGLLSFFQAIKKPPIKDWLIIFFLKGYFASFLDNLLVKKGYLEYPVSLFKTFKSSVLFSYLIFPVTCVYFNQATEKSGPLSTVVKLLLFSAPSSLIEYWLEKNTKLIKYKRNWTSLHSFFSLSATFLIVKFIMAGIKRLAKRQESNPLERED